MCKRTTCFTSAVTQLTPDHDFLLLPHTSCHSVSPPLPPTSVSEPLGVHDGGHMTKGAAPGHVCVSTALPDTMTKTHVTWRRMPDDKNTPDICLVHPGDKTRHVSNAAAAAARSASPQTPTNWSTERFYSPRGAAVGSVRRFLPRRRL